MQTPTIRSACASLALLALLSAPRLAGASALPAAAAAPAPHAPSVALSIAASSPRSAALASSPSGGKVFLTADEALALAFPKCEVKRETVYLTDAQKQRVGQLAGSELDGSIARPWTARRDGRVIGTAYLDTHKVRTLRETLFVVVDPEGRVVRTEVLAFAEPQEYLPRASWYEKFQGRALDEELRVKRAIRPVTGASLTVSATTDAVRRVLALHKVLGEPQPKR